MVGTYAEAASGSAGTLATEQLGAVDAMRASLRSVANHIVTALQDAGSAGATSRSTTLASLGPQVTAANNAQDLRLFQHASQQAG